MADKLIINARGDLGWRRRLLSDVVTLALWGGWIFLWLPVFRKLQEVIHLKLSFEPAAIQVLEMVAPISIWYSLLALLGTCALLLLWTLMPRRAVTHAHAVATLEDYAARFQLGPEAIAAGRDRRISVVHHDDHGAIIAIDGLGPAVGSETGAG